MTGGGFEFDRVAELFEAARELSGPAREQCLDEGCGQDQALRQEVEELLREVDGGGHQGLSEVAIGAARHALEGLIPETSDQAGWCPERIGPYAVVRRIAEGGMGVVYEGEQESPRRRIALKVVHPMLVTPARLGRFRQEAELLGRLRHPGIAQIYEAGSYDLGSGPQPYFAMELVDGVALNTYAADQKLGPDARLALIADICDAVQHAHDMGVIHRDLKPDNVIVDGRGQPKVLDFGVARAAEGSTAMTTLVTEEGDLLGTIAYMSPEQLEGDPELITRRSDVYALGAMAFELLAGRLPHEVVGLPLAAAVNIVREQEPARLGLLRPALKGDVQTMVGMALEKEPGRRYPSAAAFAADLRAHIEHRPITARPPSRIYRAVKFTRRNRAIVMGTLATLATLLLGLVGTGLQGQRANRAAATAERRAQRAQLLTAMATVMSRGGAAEARAFARANPKDSVPPELRGWEWCYAMSFLEDQPLILAAGEHPYSASWSLDGDRLAVAGAEALEIYSATDGRILDSVTPEGLVDERTLMLEAEWSPDGRWIAVTGLKVAFVYDPAAQRVLWVRTDLEPGRIAWDPDQEGFWAVSYVDGALLKYDATSGEILIDHGTNASLGIAFDPVGERYLQPDKKRALLLFGSKDRTQQSRLGQLETVPTTLDWKPDGRYIATAGWDMKLRIWDVAARQELLANGDILKVALGLDWHPSADLLLSAGKDQAVHLWNIQPDRARLEPLHTFRDHPNEVRRVSWSPDGSRFVAVSARQDVRVWDMQLRRPLRRLMPTGTGDDFVNMTLSWGPQGRRLLVLAGGDTELWDVHDMRLLRRLDCLVQSQLNAAGTHVASCKGGEILIEALQGDNEPLRLPIPTLKEVERNDHRFALAWHGSHDRLLYASIRGVFQVCGGKIEQVAPGAFGASVAHWLPSGTQALVTGDDGVRRIDLESGSETLAIPALGGLPPHALAPHPGGDLVALAYENQDIQIFSLGQQTWVRSLPATAVASLDWSPDGERLATASNDGTVKLWDARSGELTATFLNDVEMTCVRWSPDGASLAALGRDRRVQIWDASLGIAKHGRPYCGEDR